MLNRVVQFLRDLETFTFLRIAHPARHLAQFLNLPRRQQEERALLRDQFHDFQIAIMKDLFIPPLTQSQQPEIFGPSRPDRAATASNDAARSGVSQRGDVGVRRKGRASDINSSGCRSTDRSSRRSGARARLQHPRALSVIP